MVTCGDRFAQRGFGLLNNPCGAQTCTRNKDTIDRVRVAHSYCGLKDCSRLNAPDNVIAMLKERPDSGDLNARFLEPVLHGLRHVGGVGRDKAKAANMPAENVKYGIAKATGSLEGIQYEEVRYEGYGAHGIAIIAEALTDNRNRTGGDLRSMFAKNGGALGETNSVAFQFERKGVLRYKPEVASADAMLEAAIEAGAEDVESGDDGHEISTSVEDFATVRDALEASFGTAESAKLEWWSTNDIKLDEERAKDVVKLLDLLDDHDDIQNIYANLEVE